MPEVTSPTAEIPDATADEPPLSNQRRDRARGGHRVRTGRMPVLDVGVEERMGRSLAREPRVDPGRRVARGRNVGAARVDPVAHLVGGGPVPATPTPTPWP